MARFSEWVGRTFRLTDHEAVGVIFGQESYSGIRVTPSKAMSLSACWACIKVLTETYGNLEKFVQQVEMSEGQEIRRRLPEHDMAPLLSIAPNRWMTPQEFSEAMMVNLLTDGNAYAEVERNSAGMIISFNPMLASRMTVKQFKDGSIQYWYSTPEGVLIYDADQVMHVRLFGWTGLVGLSPIRYAAQSLGLSLAAEEFGARFFGNGARPSGFLMTDKSLTPEQRKEYKKNFADLHEGLARSHKLALLEMGFRYEKVSIPPNEAQFLETRVHQVPEVCRWYNMPPHKVQHLEHATFSNIEHLDLDFWKSTMDPYTTRFAQRYRLLLPAEERIGVCVAHDFSKLLRTDSLTQAQVHQLQTRNGIRSRNECRADLGHNPDPDGDKLTVQKQMIGLDDLQDAAEAMQGGDR